MVTKKEDLVSLSMKISRQTKNKLSYLQSCDIERGNLTQAEVLTELVDQAYAKASSKLK